MTDFKRLRSCGRGIKAVRSLGGISAKDLSSRLGVAASYLSDIETGKRPLTEAFAERIAQELGYEPQEFSDLVVSHDPESGLLTQDPPAAYRTPMPPPAPTGPPPVPPAASAACGEMELLARWFYSRLDAPARAALLADLTQKALGGDGDAASAARALLWLVRSSSLPPSSSPPP